MLPTFRILLATTGLAILAVTVATYGLIPTPEVRTRIGEVPSISRSFIQEAMAPRLAVQALSDPAEERAVMPEATGMAAGESARLPVGTSNGSETARTTAPFAPPDDQDDSSDPLGDLIRATMAQTPDPSIAGAAEPISPLPPAGTGDDRPVPDPGATAPPPKATGQVTGSAPEAASPVPTPSAGDTGKSAAQISGEDAVKAETSGTAPPQPADTAQTDGKEAPPIASPPKTSPPTVALDDQDNSRGNASARPEGEMPTMPPSAKNERGTPADSTAAAPREPRHKSARRAAEQPAAERRRSRVAVERRAARRQAAKRSRSFSSRKSRKTVRRARSHKSRTADSAPRRGVYVVAPRQNRGSAAKTRRNPATSPNVQYPAQANPYQVQPTGYRPDYSAPAGATVVR